MPALEWSSDRDVAAEIQEGLRRRIGDVRYQTFWPPGVLLIIEQDAVVVPFQHKFTLERFQKQILSDLREVVQTVYPAGAVVRLQLVQASSSESTTCESSTNQANSASPSSLRPTSGGLPESNRDGHSDHPEDGARRLSPRPEPANETAHRANARSDQDSSSPSVRLRRPEDLSSPATTPAAAQNRSTQSSLSNFCIGESNRLAHTAASMVVESPGTSSPLFLWGPPGSGKTHLVAAIRNELRSRHSLRRVVLLSAEQFTNDFTAAVCGSGLPGFRRRYRDVDALLIDDVQFVRGKQATMRELHYTVDELLRRRKQLVFTADRSPMDLEGISGELAGRMASGMVSPLKSLDQATRKSVLDELIELHGFNVKPEVVERLAEELAGDGRILSGAVNHLRMLTQMLERTVTWDELTESAPQLISAGKPAVNLQDIQKAVSTAFGLSGDALRSRGQRRAVSQPRMLAMYLARKYTRAAFSEIGEYFGNRSHSTVIAANKRVESWISSSQPLRRGNTSVPPRQLIEAIETMLRSA